MDNWPNWRIVITNNGESGDYLIVGHKGKMHHGILQFQDEEGWVDVPLVHENTIPQED